MTLTPQSVLDAHTKIASTPLVPELRFHLADDTDPFWQRGESELEAAGLPAPFWAFAWGGGQALARLIFDEPEQVAGKSVLDFATGCGIAAIAAAKAGASPVTASEIDPFAVYATRRNAALNDVSITALETDLVGVDLGWDVILAGDVFYEDGLGAAIFDWLQTLKARGASVLIGDPGRHYLPKDALDPVRQYHVKPDRTLEDLDVSYAKVWQLK